MKLAKLILPLLDNEGRDLFMQHQALQHRLLIKFGGFTKTEGAGQWRNAAGKVMTENVIVYDVAMERAAVVEFRLMAQRLAHECRQESVMIVTPCGDVEFIHPPVREMLQKSLDATA
jgi:hypothetical protein